MSKVLSNIDRDILNSLFEKIKNNTAVYDDYVSFENILKKYGVSEDRISNLLKQHNIENWQEYISKRKSAKSYKDKRETEVLIGGALMGFALGVLLSSIMSNDK